MYIYAVELVAETHSKCLVIIFFSCSFGLMTAIRTGFKIASTMNFAYA